jgi:hypothetical protein
MTDKSRLPAARMIFQWALMTAAIFWTIVYKLSESGVKVPDFVYVNF